MLLAAFAALLILPSPRIARAGTASQITLRVDATARVSANAVSCTVMVTNLGSARAESVQIHAEFRDRRYSAVVRPFLHPGESLNEEIAIDGLVLAPGRHPVSIIVEYADNNQHSFSALSYAEFVVEEDSPPRIDVAAEFAEMASSGTLSVSLSNLDPVVRDVRLRLMLPREIRADPIEKELRLDGNGEVTEAFVLRNASALAGSSYTIFAVVEYEEDGKNSCLAVPATIRVVSSVYGLGSYRTYGLVALAALVAVIVGLQFSRQPFSALRR